MSSRTKKLGDLDSNIDVLDNLTIPWLEWTDVELNNEKWALPKNSEEGLYLDMDETPMPQSLEPYEWIRARYLKDLTEPLTVFATTTDQPDLITRNKHLLHSEFVRWFISSVTNLRYCGKDGLEVSGESENFYWNGRHEPWQGWMNVYSNNKAGKAQHRPLVNPNGKYIVRLYFLGSWRRILVDDMIPVDREGNPLLPCTVNNSELWPMLLAKALLKIASLTWTRRREIVDFNPIVCLTGWICLALDVIHLSPRDKWEFLLKYAEHFEWTNEGTKSESELAPDEEKEERSKLKKKNVKSGNKGLKIPGKPRPTTLFIDLEDMKGVRPETVPGLSPCWSHLVHVVQSRDLPLDPKDVKPPLAKWKEHRWINWAIERGLLDPVEYYVPIRCLKIVSALRRCKNQMHKSQVDRERDSKKRKGSQNLGTKKTKEDVQEDLDFWVDFNKMAAYVKIIYLFYKPEYFEYNLRILESPGLDNRKKTSPGSKEAKKGSKKSAPSEIFFIDHKRFIDVCNWPKVTEMSRNEPLYLFSDSLEDKFFLINFSTMSSSRIVSSNDEADDPAPLRTISGETSYLVVERHSWFFRPARSETLISMSTSGNKSCVLELEPGRHLLRIFCRSESPCFATISSNEIFHVGDRMRMHGLMTTESYRIDALVKDISNSIAKAFTNFAGEDHRSTLRDFYRSYMPDLTEIAETKDRVFFKQIHDYFMEELVQAIRTHLQPKDIARVLSALRIFFSDPKIGLERHDDSLIVLKAFENISLPSLNSELPPNDRMLLNDHDSSELGEGEMVWIDYNRAASLIQSFFKMVLVKRYKQQHDINHQDYPNISARLLSVAELFDHTKRESLANVLWRNVIWKNERFQSAYPCSSDLQYVVQLQEVQDTLTNFKPNQWIPITRLIINARENETILGGIRLFASLPSYHLRLFDNENGREMLRLVNNVAPSNYPHTKLGYTLLGYGWFDGQKPKEMEWILHFLTMKGKPMFYQFGDEEPISANTKIPTLTVEESSGTYIPNVFNIISKWIVNITKDSVLSFRLKISYGLAKTKLKILNEQGDTLLEIEGGSVLCIPVLYLRFEDGENTNKVYYVEAYVVDDSWPLTETEWSVVLESKKKTKKITARIKSMSSSLRVQRSETLRTRRGSKIQVDQQAELPEPYWKFQAVIDADSGVEVIQDKRREKEIAVMKESWSTDDPGRPQRGKDLREAFLNAHALPEPSTIDLEKRISSIVDKPVEKRVICRRSSIGRRSSIRTSRQPRSRTFVLPPLDLTKYERTESKSDDDQGRTISEEEMFKERRLADVLDFFNAHDRFLRRLSDWTYEQVRKYEGSLNAHEENFTKRRAQLEEAYEMRRSYIASAKSIDAPKKSKAGKKGAT